MHTNKTKNQFIELRAQGWSLARIAAQLRVSKPTLVEWNRDYRDQVRSLRAVELEALNEKILAAQQQEIDQLVATRQPIDQELSTRKLADVPTPTLLNLASRLSRHIQKLRQDSQLLAQNSQYIPTPRNPIASMLRFLNQRPSPASPASSSEPSKVENR